MCECACVNECVGVHVRVCLRECECEWIEGEILGVHPFYVGGEVYAGWAVCNVFQEATHPFNSVKVAKCFCVQNTEKEGYESLAIIVFSKEKKKKTVIESMDDEGIKIPAVFQTQTLLDVYNFNFTSISIDTKRQKTAMSLF